MALVLNDRVKETSTTQGTGTLNLAGASTGFVTFVAGIGNTNTTYYCISEQGSNLFEVLPKELLKTVSLARVSGVASVTVPIPTSQLLVP